MAGSGPAGAAAADAGRGVWRRHPLYRQARRLVVAVVGSSIVLAGVAMLVLPGPGMVVIPLGLSILAVEFVWARRLLSKARAMAGDAHRHVRGRVLGQKWLERSARQLADQAAHPAAGARREASRGEGGELAGNERPPRQGEAS